MGKAYSRLNNWNESLSFFNFALNMAKLVYKKCKF